jgi:hypothetical protein
MGAALTSNTTLAALVLTCALGPLQASALAQWQTSALGQWQPSPHGQCAGTPACADSTGPVHSTRGVVKSIDAMMLVLTRSRHRAELTLSLGPTVHREGTIAAGATVSVRYRNVGGEHVAIAIALTGPHEPAGDGGQR